MNTLVTFPGYDLHITCDDMLNSLHVDGIEQAVGSEADSWKETSHIAITAGTHTIAVKCTNEGADRGLLASMTMDHNKVIVTDSSWACSKVYEEGWTQNMFVGNPENWTPAVQIGQNGVKPWLTRDSIAASAMWIWVDDNRVSLRRTPPSLGEHLV